MTVEALGQAPQANYSDTDAVIVTGRKVASDDGEIKSFNDGDSPSFSDLVDVLNPLQHIPVINTLYQHLTGDKEGAVADLVGGMLWGGAIGLGAAMANLVVEKSTGKSVGDNVLALFSDDSSDSAVAQKDAASTELAADSDAAPTVIPEPVKTMDLTSSEATTAAAATSPTETASGRQDAAANAGGPATTGDFLVFGAAKAATADQASSTRAPETRVADASPSPANARTRSVSPTTAAAAATTTAATPAPATRTVSATTASAAPTRAGDFLVFGGSQSTANETPINTSATTETASPAAASSQQPVSLTPAARTAANAAPAANPGVQQARAFPMPTSRSTITPPQTLPQPTTGPAAVPGNSRASTANRNASGQGDWFVSSFNQALDKYNRAAKLGTEGAANGSNGDAAAAQTIN
ncbi:hypothetical protein [Telmatospirillum sp.]|uniref:hypothetical protein n=1 Tax=Telmatospirillum sp. TaxID=2079197 RepID=UPI0028520D61|nr:hypothetical protein [Telmatospirillum sp.]MDR3439584.1 hypothetical protein [Telmatospirillum sp.]